jgi:hypothetical protein
MLFPLFLVARVAAVFALPNDLCSVRELRAFATARWFRLWLAETRSR